MKIVEQVTPGAADYQKDGYFIVDGIVTVRCSNCFQHLSVYDCTIEKDGSLSPVTCPNCKTVNEGIVLQGFDSKLSKSIGEVKVKEDKKR